MAAPLRAPILLSGGSSLPPVTSDALKVLAPTGSGSSGGAQVIRVGDVPQTNSLRSATISGNDPYSVAASIDRFQAAASGRTTSNVIVTSADDAAYAMPAAALAAESGLPILFVNGGGVPQPTQQALLSHQSPHIYVLGPSSSIPDNVLKQLGKYGAVKRVSGNDASSNSIAFATFRDPPCAYGKPCAPVPGSFGWAMRSPGHGYELVNSHRPLDAAAAAPLAATGSFGPELVIDDGSNMPKSILNFFLDYATPGYTQEGPTAAVYNHGWVIGDQSAVSLPVQAQMDSLLEAIPQQ
ncbi:MAG: cell wall-binding repeat-containing protein [Solirubrobacterales bacterium]|nr:cell wall-binding repeat-containing protein [Solirubrobacterales bacterium]